MRGRLPNLGHVAAVLRRGRDAIRHPIGRNAIALGSVQIATFLLPLVTIPYLSRVLGPSAFGALVLAQSMSFLLLVVVDYGFATWGAREAATLRNSPEGLTDLMRRVMSAKLLLVALAAIVAGVAAIALPVAREDPALALMAWVAAAAQGSMPLWLLIGVEDVRQVAVMQLVTRTAITALTFVVVQDSGDVRWAMGLFALAAVVPAIATLVMAGRHVRYRRPRLRLGLRPIRDAWHLFIGVGAFNMYTSANVTLLGFFATSAQVGNFGAAERIIRAGTGVMLPLAAASLPRLTFLLSEGRRHRALQLLGVLAAVMAAIGGIGSTLLVLFAEPIINLIYGAEYPQAAEVLRILGPILLLVAVSNVCGAGWMLANNLDRQVVRVAIAAAAVNIVLAAVLAPAHGPTGMAVSVLTAEIVVLLGCALAIFRHERLATAQVPS